MDTWYMGIHRSNWLADPRLADVPVFVSRNVFPKGRFPRAVGRYAIDSGGFTELQYHGRWTITPDEYVAFLDRAWEESGPFDFAAPMDMMCEDIVIRGGQAGPLRFVGTGLSVLEHQRLTTENALVMKELAPHLPIRLALQGFKAWEYERHFHMYRSVGIDLTREPLVLVGSVCRRQHMDEAIEILQTLRDLGIENLHGLGFKITGLEACWYILKTADSMSWSLDGRYGGPCQHPPYKRGRQPQSEANCLSYALAWRRHHIRPPRGVPSRQLALFEAVAA